MRLFTTISEYLSALNEGLITTHNITKYFFNLQHELRFVGFDVEVYVNNKYSYDLYINNPQIFKNDEMDELLININNNFGYYPSQFIVELKNSMKNTFVFDINLYKKEIRKQNLKQIIIRFESKYTDGLYTNNINIPDFLYHLSPIEHQNKILENGLEPKGKYRASTYPNRIHLFKNIKECDNILKNLKFNDLKKLNYKRLYTLYEINLIDLDMILHTDPNYLQGYYTYDNIHPNRIKIINDNL